MRHYKLISDQHITVEYEWELSMFNQYCDFKCMDICEWHWPSNTISLVGLVFIVQSECYNNNIRPNILALAKVINRLNIGPKHAQD